MVVVCPRTCRQLRAALTGADYATLVMSDPEEIADLIRTKKPQLALLDPRLPECDDIEPVGEIPELADLPIVFISGCGRDETIARAVEAGAVDWIVKLCSPTLLVARVGAVFRSSLI